MKICTSRILDLSRTEEEKNDEDDSHVRMSRKRKKISSFDNRSVVSFQFKLCRNDLYQYTNEQLFRRVENDKLIGFDKMQPDNRIKMDKLDECQ